MRLTCPNCGAQYEVPDEVIPQDGRDVQCSNCGNTWFQNHADQAEADQIKAPEGMVEDPEPDAVEPMVKPEVDEKPEDTPGPVRRELDPKVSEILRQEAEREARLRAEEASGGLESQPDLGLEQIVAAKPSPAAEPAPTAPEPVVKRPDDVEEGDGPIPALGDEKKEHAVEAMPTARPPAPSRPRPSEPRRDLLPDIEDINASLKNGQDPSVDVGIYDDAANRRGGGFTRGFAIGLLLIGLCALAYLNADRLVASVPQLNPAVNAYVGAIDQARVSFDSLLGALLTTPEI